MAKQPKELSELKKRFDVALIGLRDLHVQAMELGVDDIEKAAGIAHEALIDCKLARQEQEKPLQKSK